MTPRFCFGVRDFDYGKGFYLTPDIELAKEWSQNGYSIGTSYLHSYTLDLKDLKVLDLTNESVKYWVAELLYNRKMDNTRMNFIELKNIYVKKFRYPNINDFDVIIGYRADDCFFMYMRDFVQGLITEEELRDAMQFGNQGLQICLKSKKSFEYLVKADKVREVGEEYRKKRISRDNVGKASYDNLIDNLAYKKEGTRGVFIQQIVGGK